MPSVLYVLMRCRLGPSGVVAVWVTNDPAVHSFVRFDWLPKVFRPLFAPPVWL